MGDKDKMKMYLLYISRATEFFGVTKTREIYEAAIQVSSDLSSVACSMHSEFT